MNTQAAMVSRLWILALIKLEIALRGAGAMTIICDFSLQKWLILQMFNWVIVNYPYTHNNICDPALKLSFVLTFYAAE
jgi:hypothetical protein